MYLLRTPWWLRLLFPKSLVWEMPRDSDKSVYLTFDDGPHPEATAYVLAQLRKYNAKGSFFCIGKNVAEHPELYKSILAEGHTTGNHTHNHLNGWKTSPADYLANISKAADVINSNWFRPPYGRIKPVQAKMLQQAGWKIAMWSIISADFDREITPEQCLENVLMHLTPGSIVVFHDSEKAYERMHYALPKVMEHCRENGWQMKALPQ